MAYNLHLPIKLETYQAQRRMSSAPPHRSAAKATARRAAAAWHGACVAPAEPHVSNFTFFSPTRWKKIALVWKFVDYAVCISRICGITIFMLHLTLFIFRSNNYFTVGLHILLIEYWKYLRNPVKYRFFSIIF